jgi:hypothetical protein
MVLPLALALLLAQERPSLRAPLPLPVRMVRMVRRSLCRR